jgi:cytochrome P450
MAHGPFPAGSPLGLTLSTLNTAFRDDPHPILHRLRAEAPVSRDPASERVFLTRYEDVRAVLADRSLSYDLRKAREGVSARKAFGVDDPDKPYEPMMLLLDNPDHKRIRGLFSQAFNQRSVDALRPRIRRIVEELLDDLAGLPRFDLIERFARPLPVLVIAEMMGVSTEDRAIFTE